MITSGLMPRWASMLAAALTLTSTYAAALRVGVSSSLSGPLSALGIPYEKGIRAAFALHPEIAGRKVQLIVLDDASDPTTAARNARKLIGEDAVDVLIRPRGAAPTARRVRARFEGTCRLAWRSR